MPDSLKPVIDPNHQFPEAAPAPVNPETSGYVPRSSTSATPPPVIRPQVAPAPTQEYVDPQYQYLQNVQQDVQSNAYFQVGEEAQPEAKPEKKSSVDTKALWEKTVKFLEKRWWAVLIAAIILGVLVVGVYALQAGLNRPISDFTKVQAFVEAPKTSSSGSPNRWKITIKNDETVSIQQIELKLNFDRTFRYSKPINPDPADPSGSLYKLSSLQGVGQGTSDAIISFEGVLSGNIDEETVMSGELSYVPTPLLGKQNARRSLQINPARTRITAAEISLEMVPTAQTVQNGNEVELSVIFENRSERELKDMRIRMLYPDKGAFTYTSSDLTITTTGDTRTKPDDGNDIWYITNLPRLRKQTLRVRGTLTGAEGVRQTFGVEIGSKGASGYETLQTTSRDITITSQPLVMSTKINGRDDARTFAPGETLTFEIAYQNKSTQSLKNIEIFGSIEDPADILDYQTLVFQGDSQGNVNNRVVQWRSSGVAQLENLAPQSRGILSYSVKVKDGDQFIKSGLNQTAYTLRPNVEGKGVNLPQIKTSGELYKARGNLLIDQKVEQIKDETLPNNKRIYEVTWTLKTRQNKVNDITLDTITNLPPASWNQSTVKPVAQSGKLSYNSANGKLSWKPGSLDAYAGISRDVVSVTFRLEVTVAPGKGFGGIELFSDSAITGIDDFTGEKFEKTLPRAVIN
jgi:hypothetical protein